MQLTPFFKSPVIKTSYTLLSTIILVLLLDGVVIVTLAFCHELVSLRNITKIVFITLLDLCALYTYAGIVRRRCRAINTEDTRFAFVHVPKKLVFRTKYSIYYYNIVAISPTNHSFRSCHLLCFNATTVLDFAIRRGC